MHCYDCSADLVLRVAGGGPAGAGVKRGTEQLAAGDLGYQIGVGSNDEIGELAQLIQRHEQPIEARARRKCGVDPYSEERVEHKTHELKRAHEHALHTEKMASIGKMAAVLAHEINNPLSGILTYAKLLRKWVDRDDAGARAESVKSAIRST